LHARLVEKKRESSVQSIDSSNETIKISLLKKYHFKTDGLSEPLRREQEFQVMRKIEDEAEWRQRWMSLGVSTGATLILWLMGALVFSYTETDFSYFDAVYFSYTTLLTIGYGDIQPVSNSGKSFFVLWTILAVPTLTILISHMGDTIISAFANFTIWAGTLTILPDDNRGASDTLRILLRRIFKNINPKEFTGPTQPPGFLPQRTKEEDAHAALRNHILDRFSRHIADDELTSLGSSREGMHDTYTYIYVLLRELTTIMTDLTASPAKKYSYKDWAWYLRLLGQDEGDESLHQHPAETATHKEDEIGLGGVESNLKWSWFGVRSPLMSTKTESEWIAEHLSKRLESEMERLRRGRPNRTPPVTMKDLVERMDGKSAPSSV